jgi:hypothetical protein
MEMKMENRLTTVFPTAVDHSVTVGKALRCGNFRNRLENSGNSTRILSVYFIGAGNMFLRNNKYMHRSLWIDIPESVDEFIFIDFCGGNLPRDDFAE